MQDLPETPDERAQRRRVRRWKRRARILAPFLGIPILLAALALSVDMIEYVPQPPPDKLADRPINLTPGDAKRPTPRPLVIAKPDLALPVDAPDALEDDGDAKDLDVILPASLPPRPPTPPFALRRP